MTKHGRRTSSERRGWLRWSLSGVLTGILALSAGESGAQSMDLDIERRGHPTSVSTETHGAYLKYGVTATGDTSMFCGQTETSGCLDRDKTDDAHTMPYAVEIEWTATTGGSGGLPSRTVGGLNPGTATSKPTILRGVWRWDDKTEGPIEANEHRPLLATIRLIKIGSEYNVGSNNTLKYAVNPQISVENDEATEGTDTHLIFKVTLLPPALETTTVDYGTQGASATGGGVDFTDTNGTLTWTAGQSIKYVRVPIIDDSVSDGGEEMLLQVTNASGVTRFIDPNGDFQAAGLGGIGTINNDEPSDDLVGDLPLVSIEADAESETEGSRASFTLSRTGEATDALTVSLTVAEDGAMLAETTPTSASFDAGSATATIDVDTVGDDTDEADSKITVTLATGDGYKLGTNNQSEATTTILDDDAATLPGGTVAVAGTTVWTADMTVTDYGNGSIGAGTAALLANQRGSEGLQARNLYYHTGERKLRMAFTSSVNTTLLTLAAGSVKLKFPESRSGDSSFTWENVAVDWADEQTFEARLVRGEQEAVDAPDPTLKTLTVSDATLSPAFDADTVAYTATVVAATERVTVSGTLNDDDASLAYTPSTDADSSTAGHQVDVAVGDTTTTVTVTAADGETTRAYRVVVKRPAPDVETSTPTLSIADGSGTEGADSSIGFTVTLDEAATDTVTVDYATSDGTATAGTDYTAASGTLTFDAGTTSKTISVSIADDETDESDETFTLTLSNAAGADLGTSTATGTITNRAVVVETTPTLSIAGGNGTEGDDSSITFTVTLDEAASGSVTVDYATSDGTAEAGDDYTATSGTLTFNAGTTSKTISVSIENDVENESDETFTVTLSNASGADLGTSTATGTIRNRRVEPLTASFSGMPSEHDGSSFTFELHFSENPEVGFRTLKNHAFTVDEGDVTRAQRKNPQSADKNKAWTITVEPDGNDTLTITLPATTSCSSNRGICTDDERKLSHSTSATVEGPIGISVGDVEVEEGAGVVLAFQVALTRATSSTLTIDYSTSDGSATAGADYTSTSGTLTIGAGSSSGTVEVPVIDDEHNEGSETFTLTLSNASSGTLTDASATGTITNHDALPAALVARFGRTAAVHVVDQVEERVNAPRAPGFDGRVAGRQINPDMGQDFALDFLQQLGGGYGAPAAGGASPGGGMTSSLGPQGRVASRGPMAQGGGLQRPMPMVGGLQHEAGFGLSMGGRDRVLQGSGFALNRATSSGDVLSFWSRSAQSSFYGQDGALALNGDVRSTMFGADYSKGRMITGVSLSHSRGLGSYAGVDTGRMTSAVTGLYPWIGFRASERVTVWTVAGYGAGGLLLSPGAGAPVQTGLSMALAAGGGRGELLAGDNGFGLAFKADALWVGTRTDAASGPSGNLDATRAGITRLRTALEGSQSMTVGGRMAFTPSVELGIRQDGGDAEVGGGLDVGLGLVVADAVTGLAVDVRIRRLLVHQAAGFSESGMAVSVSYDPSPKTPLGFTARVAPAWGGDAMSGAEALWGRETMSGMGQYGMPIGGSRLDTEVGYGLPLGARFVGTPRVGVRRSEYGRDYRVGYGMQVLEQGRLNLELGIDAERRENPVFHLQEGSAGTDQRVLGHATVQW